MTHKRSSGRISFLMLRDGTGSIQATCVQGETDQHAVDLYPKLTQESSLAVTGTVRRDERAPGGYELLVSRIEVLQLAETYPISPKEHGVGFLMDHRHLWIRSPRQQAILRIRHTVINAARRFFDDEGFTLLDAPILRGDYDPFRNRLLWGQEGLSVAERATLHGGRCYGPWQGLLLRAYFSG